MIKFQGSYKSLFFWNKRLLGKKKDHITYFPKRKKSKIWSRKTRGYLKKKGWVVICFTQGNKKMFQCSIRIKEISCASVTISWLTHFKYSVKKINKIGIEDKGSMLQPQSLEMRKIKFSLSIKNELIWWTLLKKKKNIDSWGPFNGWEVCEHKQE